MRQARLDFALALALVAFVVVETLGNDSAPHPAARAVLASIAVASVAFRRSHPTAAATIFSAAMTVESLTTESPDEGGVLIAILLVSFSVAAHAPRREALLGGGLLVLALSLTIATDPSDSVANIPLSVMLFIGLPGALGLVVRRRQEDVATLTLEAEALAREAEGAVELERRRIARELHDVVSHAVTLIAVQAEAGQAVLDSDPESARRSLVAIGQVSREALAELTRLLAVLREDVEPVADSGLANLGSLVEGARAAGLDVSLQQVGIAVPLDAGTDRCAYRIVQEGLTNALRHSSDARVKVELEHQLERLSVRVSSFGRPHTSSYGGAGRGLTGLRERVAVLGGRFEAGPVGGGGFEVAADLPIRATESLSER